MVNKHCATTVITYGILALAGAVSISLPESLPMTSAATPASTDTVRVPGVVRDFHRTDSEYNLHPSNGHGHYAGNISHGLGSDYRPDFTGGGFKVATQWRDKSSYNIPPHLFMNGVGMPDELLVTNPSPSGKHGTFDTWNSGVGPYGGSNVGPAPTVVTGAPMPDVAIPITLSSLPNQGDLSYSGNNTISSNIHCDAMNVSGTLIIDGKISILCEDTFSLATHTVISLNPGARLTLYLMNGGSSWNHVEFNKNTGKPNRVLIFNASTNDFVIHNHAEVYATIISPHAQMEISNHGEFFGRFVGKEIYFKNHANYHHDESPATDFCGVNLGDTLGTKGPDSSGGIHSATAFDRWFADVPGTNISSGYVIELVRNGSGVFEYLDDAFYPIDGLLFGNEGESHNYYFTYSFAVSFVHNACSGKFIEFQGADDAWIFVDGQLAVDLGGVIPGVVQRVDVDRLNMVGGQSYSLHLFYAQRNSSFSQFRFRTNLQLIAPEPPVTATASYD